jgi:pyrroline-5-carboxylate reductase
MEVFMNCKIGFIGAGFMGMPIIRGIINTGVFKPENICIFDLDIEKTLSFAHVNGVVVSNSSKELTETCDIIMICVKPNVVKIVLDEIKPAFTADKILVSIAAGIPLKTYKEAIGQDKKVVRSMPNQPALIGAGMTLISYDNCLTKEDIIAVEEIFSAVGEVESIDEKLMNAVISLTSSSPAYVFMLIEAMADAAVLEGIPRDQAYRLAANAVAGSAKMVAETGTHPGELKDTVCSPGGTTIAALRVLEQKGFRSAIIEAMDVCTKRAFEMGKLYE